MAKFTDRTGREWAVEITLGDVEPLGGLGFDVESFDLAPLRRPAALGAVLWHLCEAQAAERGVSPEQFARSLGGPARFAAVAAVEAAVLDFSLPPTVAAKAIGRRATERAATIERLEREAEAIGDPGGPSAGAGNSAASSDSTPGPSASAGSA